MDENEKMTALKKAYAEIILNTAKEAAAKIMVSERKAHELQRDLCSTKEEALRLLLRLKQMMDSKNREAEARSAIQQQRIDELEAQLQEAEDVVTNLRAELSEAHAEVERLSKNQQQRVAASTEMMSVVYQSELEEQENRQKTPEFSTYISHGLKPEGAMTSEAQISTLNQMNDKHRACIDSHLQGCLVCNPVVPSIVMRNKEPEPYRNGCTQRIRACGRNTLNGHVSPFGELVDPKNTRNIKEDKEAERIFQNPAPEKVSVPAEIEAAASGDKIDFRARKVNCRSRRRRTNGYSIRRTAGEPAGVQITEALKVTDNSDSQTCPSVSGSDSLKTSDAEDASDRPPVLDAGTSSDVPEMATLSRPISLVCSEMDKASTSDKHTELANGLVLIGKEYVSGNDVGVSSSEADLEVKNTPLVVSDVKASNSNDSVQALKDRPFKYTFQRKRKKESLSCDGGGVKLDESSMKRRREKQQDESSIDALKSSETAESSRDSRRMAQVARQLISLSEKKWWQ